MRTTSFRLMASSPAGRLSSPLRLMTVGLLAITAACLAMPPARGVAIDWVTVGDAGNANDPATGGLGAVNYEYRIGKYEVTIGQYAEFLNAVDPNGTNTYGLYNDLMGTNGNIRGILFSSGSLSGQKYSPIGSSTRPITYVSWFDAARFANWMHNGQGNGSTETGAYTLVDGQTSGEAPARNPHAQFSIPTESEWYKAAYFSPLLNSGSGGYRTYATQSDTEPGNTIGNGSNQANFSNAVFSVTQSADYDPDQNYLTDVGAYVNSGSYYGTFDQSGNVFEWNDLTGDLPGPRGLRGGGWLADASFASSSATGEEDPDAEVEFIGFRLASPTVILPEPSTWVMGVGGFAWAVCGAWRRRKRA